MACTLARTTEPANWTFSGTLVAELSTVFSKSRYTLVVTVFDFPGVRPPFCAGLVPVGRRAAARSLTGVEAGLSGAGLE